jgi:cytochrome c-type biogenesis protein
VTLAISLNPAGLGLAFAAGLVSFISPCVLPLVPGYLSYVSGVGFDELGARTRRVTTTTAAFVVGFTAMFVALGAGAGWFGNGLLTHKRLLETIAGAFIIAAALIMAGLPLPGPVARERRFALRGGAPGHVNAGLAGVGFAVAWTPCLGPTLAGILTLAASAEPTQGAILLAIYSIGLGVPFLLSGLVFTRALGVVQLLRRHWRVVSLVSAAFLLAFGVLLVTGDFTRLTHHLTRYSQFGSI